MRNTAANADAQSKLLFIRWASDIPPDSGLRVRHLEPIGEYVKEDEVLGDYSLQMCYGDSDRARHRAVLATHSRRVPVLRTTRKLDDLRAAEYPGLDRQGHTYLDFTAANLYATSQLTRHHALLRDAAVRQSAFDQPDLVAATEYVARARRAVLRFFNASPDEWAVIFTANASHALKLIGESYPFGPGDRFLLTFDNHNSVNGIREFARAAGATATYVPVVLPDMRVDERDLARELDDVRAGKHTCFRTRRSRTSPACSTRSNGSRWRAAKAGTCCSTPRRSRPPTGSTSAGSARLRRAVVL